jgi:hypothetical protein
MRYSHFAQRQLVWTANVIVPWLAHRLLQKFGTIDLGAIIAGRGTLCLEWVNPAHLRQGHPKSDDFKQQMVYVCVGDNPVEDCTEEYCGKANNGYKRQQQHQLGRIRAMLGILTPRKRRDGSGYTLKEEGYFYQRLRNLVDVKVAPLLNDADIVQCPVQCEMPGVDVHVLRQYSIECAVIMLRKQQQKMALEITPSTQRQTKSLCTSDGKPSPATHPSPVC